METKPLREHLGARIRLLREAQGLRQEEVVTRAHKIGLRWTPSVVTAIENGNRSLTVGEFLLLPAILGGQLAEILCDEDTVVELAPGLLLPCSTARLLLTSQWSGDVQVPRTIDKGDDGPDPERAVLEAERKAAVKIGISPEDLVAAAVALWGHNLSTERERVTWQRIIATGGDPRGTPMRSYQAIRGHVTRDLIATLQTRVQSQNQEEGED